MKIKRQKGFNLFLFFLFFTPLFFQHVLGQDRQQRSIYLELFGASNTIGISYDARIKRNSPWGYRVGVGYAYSSSSSFLFDNSSSTRGVSLPLEVNYLLGKKRNMLELGVGTNLGFYRANYSYREFSYEQEDDLVILVPKEMVEVSEDSFGYYLYATLGYRFQAKNGFQFRMGVSPSFNFADSHGIERAPKLYPYLSLGYSF